MDSCWVGADGRIHLREFDETSTWPSLAALADDFWRYQRLNRRARADDPMRAWTCVSDLVAEPAWDRALDVIDVLLRSAANDEEIALVAAGPLEDLFSIFGEGPRFIADAERRARRDRMWTAAVGAVWLDREGDPEVNRRLAVFGARHADGTRPT